MGERWEEGGQRSLTMGGCSQKPLLHATQDFYSSMGGHAHRETPRGRAFARYYRVARQNHLHRCAPNNLGILYRRRRARLFGGAAATFGRRHVSTRATTGRYTWLPTCWRFPPAFREKIPARLEDAWHYRARGRRTAHKQAIRLLTARYISNLNSATRAESMYLNRILRVQVRRFPSDHYGHRGIQLKRRSASHSDIPTT